MQRPSDPFKTRAQELVDFLFNSPVNFQKYQCDGCNKYFGLPSLICDEGDSLSCNRCLQDLFEEMRNS